jgi:penicillin-binding protein 1A
VTWKPGNYSDKFYGPIPLRSALAKSRNIATIKVLRDIGVGSVIKMAEALGIEQRLEANLALGLGASEVTLAELVRAYATFPAGGRRVEPIFILEVRDREGQLLEQNVPLFKALQISERPEEEEDGAPDGNGSDPVEEPEQLIQQIRTEFEEDDEPDALPPGYGLDPVTAYLMTDMLRAVVQEGTGARARALGRPTGGKTGTTNDLKDAWYIGFSPQLVSGVWVGYDSARPLGKSETGSRAAAPIFVDFAGEVLRKLPVRDFPVPDGVVFARIDRATGKIACAGDSDALFQPFREGTVPIEQASCFQTNGSGSSSFPPRMD